MRSLFVGILKIVKGYIELLNALKIKALSLGKKLLIQPNGCFDGLEG